MNLIERKEEIKNLAISKGEVGAMIYDLINKGDLDHIIKKITDVKTKGTKGFLCEKGYFTGNEQFYSVLEQYIYIFQRNFASLSYKSFYISLLLQNKIPKFLLCKNYWGNNDFIPFYQYNIKKNFVENMYHNINYIYNNTSLNSLFKIIGIKNKLSLRNGKNVELLFNYMQDFIWANYDEYACYVLFQDYKVLLNDSKSNNQKDALLNTFCIHWEIVLDNYINKKDAINIVLNRQ